MSAAAASLAVAVVLVAAAGLAWLAGRAENGPALAGRYRSALADWALAALALRTITLLVGGSASPLDYGITILLACAAAWCRSPATDPPDGAEPASHADAATGASQPAGAGADRSPVVPAGGATAVPERHVGSPAPAAAAMPRGTGGTLWARRQPDS